MRVLHVTDTYLPRLGGIEVLVDDLAAHQRRAGHQVRVLTSTPAPGPDDAATTRLGNPLFSPVADRIRAYRPDAVHCHSSIVSPLAWRSARSAAALGVPVLVTMHSMVPRQGLVPAGLRQLAQAMPNTVAWSAVSAAAARALRPVVGHDVLVLPNGLDQDSCQVARPGTHEIPLVVSVMRLAHRKRPLELVAILAQVKARLGDRPWRAVIVGDGPLKSATAQAVRRAGLEDHVELTGRLDRAQIMRLLAQADLYLAPAYLESFGIAALEARCSGLPVVAMSSGGVSEFIGDGTHGHLVRNDAEMAARTAAMLVDPAGLQVMARHSLADPPRLDWPDVVDRSLDAYRVARIRATAAVPSTSAVLVGSA
jgi:glycosyltransferase involved in cell wall biosynthesis